MKAKVLAALMVLAGAALLWFGLHSRHAAVAGLDWPTTQGKIVDRGVEYYQPRGWYYARVKYSYAVAGKTYQNDRIYQIGRLDGTKDDRQHFVDALPDPVPVHYDPADPQQAYLVANPTWTYWLMIGCGALVLLVGLVQVIAIFGKTSS